MGKIERCLSEIQAVREVAEGHAAPYVARSRLGRLALTTAMIVAEEAGLPSPDLPGAVKLPVTAAPEVLDLARCCNRIADTARHIAQPSEPLAERWERNWHQLLDDLADLEGQIRRRA